MKFLRQKFQKLVNWNFDKIHSNLYFFWIFTKLKIYFWKNFSQSFATKSPDIWFWILPFYAMRLRYFRIVLENHIALLFQRSYSKITSRCYSTEVTRNHIALLFHRSARNHIALLFQMKLLKITSRCYFIEVLEITSRCSFIEVVQDFLTQKFSRFVQFQFHNFLGAVNIEAWPYGTLLRSCI